MNDVLKACRTETPIRRRWRFNQQFLWLRTLDERFLSMSVSNAQFGFVDTGKRLRLLPDVWNAVTTHLDLCHSQHGRLSRVIYWGSILYGSTVLHKRQST